MTQLSLKAVFRSIVFVTLTIVAIPVRVSTADIQVVPLKPTELGLDEGKVVVSLSGEIVSGDADKFFEIIDQHNDLVLVLESPGGIVNDAYQIAAELQLRGLSTLVRPQTECYSACALIWLGGKNRYMSDTSVIGFHQVHVGGVASGQGNATYGGFLSDLGMNKWAIQYLSAAGPESTENLTPDMAKFLGIDVYVASETGYVGPDEITTMPELARQTASAVILGSSPCREYFGTDAVALQNLAVDWLTQYFGSPKVEDETLSKIWLNYLGTEIDVAKSASEPLAECALREAELLSDGRSLPVSGPGFACPGSDSFEAFICSDYELSALHRAVKIKLDTSLEFSKEDRKAEIRENYGNWRELAIGCGANRDCIRNAFSINLASGGVQKASSTNPAVKLETPTQTERKQERTSLDLLTPSTEETIAIQLALSLWGLYDGMQDGNWGPRSKSSLNAHAAKMVANQDNDPQAVNLLKTLKYEVGQHGWEYGDALDIGLSYLFPSRGYSEVDEILPGFRTFEIDDSSVFFAGKKHNGGEISKLHQTVLKMHDFSRGQPYTVRKDDLIISVAIETDYAYYLRSELGRQGWASILVSGSTQDYGHYFSIVGSISDQDRKFRLLDFLLSE